VKEVDQTMPTGNGRIISAVFQGKRCGRKRTRALFYSTSFTCREMEEFNYFFERPGWRKDQCGWLYGNFAAFSLRRWRIRSLGLARAAQKRAEYEKIAPGVAYLKESWRKK